MTSLFVSHSSTDRTAANRVVERVAAEGYAALFIDFDPAHGIPAGRSWERELYAQLRKDRRRPVPGQRRVGLLALVLRRAGPSPFTGKAGLSAAAGQRRRSRTCSNASVKSPDDEPRRYRSVSTLVTIGDLRHQ